MRVPAPGTRARGWTTVDLIVSATTAMAVLGALGGLVGTGSRHLLATGLRLETDDMVAAAFESFAFDVRRAGWDPTAAAIEAVLAARDDTVTLQADLDGDGTIDAASEERIRWACLGEPPRLARIVGAQSMPLAGDVVACRFAFFDANGRVLPAPPGGLDPAGRRAVRAIRLALALRPVGLDTPTVRETIVARRDPP